MSKILLIDDDPQVLNIFKQYLSKAGHTVTTACNGLQGMRLLARDSFDLIITDILMPECDGLELLRTLRTTPDRPRIIAISGGSSFISPMLLLDLAGKLQADKILPKPLDYETLTQAVWDTLATQCG